MSESHEVYFLRFVFKSPATTQFTLSLGYRSEARAREALVTAESCIGKRHRVLIEDEFGNSLSCQDSDILCLFLSRTSGSGELQTEAEVAELRRQMHAKRKAESDPQLKTALGLSSIVHPGGGGGNRFHG